MVEGILGHGVAFGTVLTLFGLLIGSFLTVVIHRGPIVWGLIDTDYPLPERYSLSLPRSHCLACKTVLKPWDLIPVVSYLARRGRCGTCDAPIGARYPITEALTGAAGLLAASVAGDPLTALALFTAFAFLIALGAIDLETGYLPDALTLPMMAAGLLFSLGPALVTPEDAILGLSFGAGGFFFIGWVYALVRGRDGLGGGDAKLLGAGGAFVGAAALPIVVLIASATALIVTLIQRGRKVSTSDEIRFGPFLGIGIGAVLLVRAASGSL